EDLGSDPLADVSNPPLRNGAYTFGVKLPQRTGRQMLYIVWQTTSTVDTYYSCSDLVFGAAAATAAPVTTKAAPKPSSPPTSTGAPVAQDITPVSDDTKATLGHQIIVGALLLAAGAVGVAAFGRIR